MLNPAASAAPADVLILPMTGDLSAAISFATALRAQGVRAQLHCEQKKFKQKLNYANKLAIPFAAFLGEDEVKAGTVTVKNLLMGDDFTEEEKADMESQGFFKQVTLPVAEAVSYVKNCLSDPKDDRPILDKEYISVKYDLDKPQA